MMPTDKEVRAWCRENGIEVPERGKLNPSFHEQWADAHPDFEPDVEQLVDDERQEHDDEPAGERPPALRLVDEPAPETPPRSPRPPKFSLFKRAAAAGRSRGPKRRVSLESTLAAGWSILSAAAAQAGQTPTSRVLAMQAPVAGVILEESLKGTVADRVLQPLARMTQTGSKVGALLGPPVIVMILSQRPALAPQLVPALRLALTQWVMVAGPAMKAQERKQAKAMEALGLDGEDSLNTMIEGMVDAIFADFEDPAGAEYDAA